MYCFAEEVLLNNLFQPNTASVQSMNTLSKKVMRKKYTYIFFGLRLKNSSTKQRDNFITNIYQYKFLTAVKYILTF